MMSRFITWVAHHLKMNSPPPLSSLGLLRGELRGKKARLLTVIG